MAKPRPSLQQEYGRWWPILSAGGSQCYWPLAASFWGRQEAALSSREGPPGGHFCESCIFERSYSVAFTYQIRYVLAGTGSNRFLDQIFAIFASSVGIPCVTHAETSQAHAPPAKLNTQVQLPWPHVMPSNGSSKKGTRARGSRGR